MKPLLCSTSVVRNFLNVQVGVWPARAIDQSKPMQWQDRRPCKSSPWIGCGDCDPCIGGRQDQCAVGRTFFSQIKPRDVLYVRETCQQIKDPSGKGRGMVWEYRADWSREDEECCRDFKWLPAIHAPKESSRIHLEVMRVRVERACDIEINDAIAEGMSQHPNPARRYIEPTPTSRFKDLWISLYGPDAWEKWCWVYDLKRIK